MEFHAFILCGSGKQLHPFSQSRTTGLSKALLPIANRPMIEYVLEWCDKAFFPQITIVCDEGSEDAISKVLHDYQGKRQQIRKENAPPAAEEHLPLNPSPIDIMAVASHKSGVAMYEIYKKYSALAAVSGAGAGAAGDLSTGTTTPTEGAGAAAASAAASAAAASSGGASSNSEATTPSMPHFVFLPCDFVTDLPPQVLIDAYRKKPANDLGLLVNYHNQFELFADKKTFNKTFGSQINYTVYSQLDDSGELRLLDLYSKEDVEFHKALSLRTQMTWRYPNATIATKLLNSSIFFGDSEKVFSVFAEAAEAAASNEVSSTAKFIESYFRHRTTAKVIRDLARRTWKHSSEKASVGLLVLPKEASFFRCNNIPVYMEANRHVMKQHQQSPQAHSAPLAATSSTASTATTNTPAAKNMAAIVGADALVDASTTLGERTNVKRTVIGKSCVIGKRVKLTGCLLFDNVTIEDDVHLENCIIGHDVLIQGKVKLTNCNVEATLEVAKGTQAKGEVLLCLSLEGIEGAAPGSGAGHGADSDADDYAIGGYSDSESDSDDSGSDDYSDGELNEYGDNSDGLFAY